MILFIDTETSGFPLTDKTKHEDLSLNNPKQARILEIACILTDDQGKVISMLDTLVTCGDIELREGLPHDITVEDCNERGISLSRLRDIIHFFSDTDFGENKRTTIVAHNIGFDEKMLKLHGIDLRKPWTDFYCTMKSTTDICKIPHMRNSGYKFPKLDEAHAYFFGETMKSNHRAMGDAIMCKEIYFALKNKIPLDSSVEYKTIKKEKLLEGDWNRKPEIKLQEL